MSHGHGSAPHTLVAELRREIRRASGRPHPRPERRFHKHDEYLSYDLATPAFRALMKTYRPRIRAFALRERMRLAADLLAEHVGELGHAGIHVVALSVADLGPRHLPALDRLADDFRSWSHVDHFCGDVMQPLLWIHREEVLALLGKWSRSRNRWKRRASVVPFTRKVGASGAFTEEVLERCEQLIWDPEDIVRKGVGWALKDNVYSARRRIVAYIRDLRQRGASSTIVLYAIRNLEAAERAAVMSVKRGTKQ